MCEKTLCKEHHSSVRFNKRKMLLALRTNQVKVLKHWSCYLTVPHFNVSIYNFEVCLIYLYTISMSYIFINIRVRDTKNM